MVVFKNDLESLVLAYWHLDEHDTLHPDDIYSWDGFFVPPFWPDKTQDELYKGYGTFIVERAKELLTDDQIQIIMQNAFATGNMSEQAFLPEPDQASEQQSVSKFGEITFAKIRAVISGACNLGKVIWTAIPERIQDVILSHLAPRLSHRLASGGTDISIGSIVMGVTSCLCFGYDCYTAIKRFKDNEISDKRLMKIIVDSLLVNLAGVAGCLAGTALGGLITLNPVFGTIGGIAGKFAFAKAMEFLSSRFTQWMFNIPEDEALEKAYDVLGLDKNASNQDLIKRYHQLCLLCHPDKHDISPETFHNLQASMAIIRTARNLGPTSTETPDRILAITDGTTPGTPPSSTKCMIM